VPDPSDPPLKGTQWTGHFTSYKHRTNHELATLMGRAGRHRPALRLYAFVPGYPSN